MKATESDLWEDKRKFSEEKEVLQERMPGMTDSNLLTYTKCRIEVLTELIKYIDKIIGD